MEAEAAEETVMAQVFDAKLEREISRGRGRLVKVTKNLGGWTAMTSESQLQYAQYAEAVTTLPTSHPAYRGLMEDMFRSLKK
ncbi:hypothetical protein M378DRAFT_173948 [Amanita muscaria Koide BX008]|uniref:Uncharacterized protein n=1 Tax=Amanita muscaria (strain Koide BX008) TaxID=946122 RepID=A0A0C2W1B8_AMAMK|nr:hypothetical protein M378DRAFT_173948 [Amanita muscaria Koide BX008]